MRHPATPAYATMLVTFLAACGGDSASPTPEQEARTTVLGRQAASALTAGLLGHLTAAMQEGGATAAVTVCSEQALFLTDSIAAELGEGIELKRTTFRYRNPLNAPDEVDASALRRFEALQATGEEPAPVVLKTPRDYRYYVPLRIVQPCLGCHGKPEQMDPEVMRVLGELYPEDRATGYEEGDLRGAIRVSIPPAMIET